jgi:hypothetical protein
LAQVEELEGNLYGLAAQVGQQRSTKASGVEWCRRLQVTRSASVFQAVSHLWPINQSVFDISPESHMYITLREILQSHQDFDYDMLIHFVIWTGPHHATPESMDG